MHDVEPAPVYISDVNHVNVAETLADHTKHIQTNNQIPHIIFQSWSNIIDLTDTPILYHCVQSWTQLNPTYLHYIYTDTAVQQYIDTYLDKQINNKLYVHRDDIITAYHKLHLIVQKIDLWRLLIIYEYGGVYADIDTECVDSIDTWGIKYDSTMISGLGERGDLHQWLLVYTPQHILIHNTILNVVNNILSNDIDYINGHVEAVSGPPVLQHTYEQLLSDSQYTDVVSHMQILPNDYMNGHVKFKVNGIDDELKTVGHTHWIELQDEFQSQHNLMYYGIATIILMTAIVLIMFFRCKHKFQL